MKTKNILMVVAVLAFAATAVHADVVAQYNFTGGAVTSSDSQADTTASDYGTNTIAGELTGDAYWVGGDDTTGFASATILAEGDYNEFTIAVDSGWGMDLADLTYTHSASNYEGFQTRAYIFVDWEKDGFDDDDRILANVSILRGDESAVRTVDLSALPNLTGTIAFRVYWGDESSSSVRSSSIDDIVVNSVVVDLSLLPAELIVIESAGSTDSVEATDASSPDDSFAVVLNAPPTADVDVVISTNFSEAIWVSTNVLTFTSGNWNTPQTVQVQALQASDPFRDATITLDLQSTDPDYNALADSSVVVHVAPGVQVVASYDFDGGAVTSSDSQADTTASDYGTNTIAGELTGDAYWVGGDDTTGFGSATILAEGDYNEFTIAVDSGWGMDLADLTYTHSASNYEGFQTRAYIFVDWEKDGFDDDDRILANFSILIGDDSAVRTVDLSALPNLTGTIAFRVYWGDESSSSVRSSSIDDIVVNSVVVDLSTDIAIAKSAGGFDLTWTTIPGSTYALLEKTNLVFQTTWSTNQTGIPGSVSNATVTVPSDKTAAFYKSIVE